MKLSRDSILASLILHGRNEIHRVYTADCCIAATRIVIECLKKARCEAKPLVCLYKVVNAAGRRFVETRGWPRSKPEAERWHKSGCHIIETNQDRTARGYNGHVITITDSYLLDLTLDQCNRPQKNIRLSPCFRRFQPTPGPDGLSQIFDDNGCTISYVFQPQRLDYLFTTDWTNVEYWQPVVDQLITHAQRFERDGIHDAERNAINSALGYEALVLDI